jgi:hypothetical protein
MSYTQITLNEFNNLCKPEKGWVRNRSGYEYVYDYRIPNTRVMIKILSSVHIETEMGRNKGSDAIRVFAVLLNNEDDKVKRGLVKAITVYRTKGWKDNTIQAYKDVRDIVYKMINDKKI